MPVEIAGRSLAVIGGRAFSTGADYRDFVERARNSTRNVMQGALVEFLFCCAETLIR